MWDGVSRSGDLPDDIPGNPRQTYQGNGWLGYDDWSDAAAVRVILRPIFIMILNLPRKRRGAPAAPPVPRFPTNASVHPVPSRVSDAPTRTPAAVLAMHARPFL